jgi:hypothetical protein
MAIGRWDGGTDETSLIDNRGDEQVAARGNATNHFRMMRDLIDKQSQPAAIVFKNQAPSVLGYLASVDDECVVLRSLYREESKEQTILIPWENILYIRLNTKVPPTEQAVTASRESRVQSPARIRRW